jgi:hypothetical protein
LTIRTNTSNIDAFIDIVGTENCEGAINTNLLDNKRTNGALLKSGRIVDNLEDLIAWFIIAEAAAKVFAAVIFVDQGLTTIAKIIVVGNDWNRQKHVSLKDKSTG